MIKRIVWQLVLKCGVAVAYVTCLKELSRKEGLERCLYAVNPFECDQAARAYLAEAWSRNEQQRRAYVLLQIAARGQ